MNDCSNNGFCNNSICKCYPGYCGTDCSITECNCLNGGQFINNSCSCPNGYIGNLCQKETCEDLDGCNSQGDCKDKTCHCFSVDMLFISSLIICFIIGLDWINMFFKRMSK